MTEKHFYRQKIVSKMKISQELFNDSNFALYKSDGLDFIQNQLTARLETYVYENEVEERTLTYTFDKPTFLDWLFGRKRQVKISVSVKDLLKNAPSNVHRIALVNFDEQ